MRPHRRPRHVRPDPDAAAAQRRPEPQVDLLSREVIAFDPPVEAKQFRDPFGNVATRILVPGGRVTMSADFEIEDHGQPDDHAPDARQIPVHDLPDEALPLLLGSRYCDADKLSQTAWNLFGSTPDGLSGTSIAPKVTVRPAARRALAVPQ